MHSAQVVLTARFDSGADVMLVRVRDERTLRAEGGEMIDRRRAGEQGTVTFTSRVEPGARYIAVGVRDRHPLEVRARGQQGAADAPQPPPWPARPHRLRRPLDQPTAETSARRQEDVHGVPQRSDTPKGTATPLA
jgi:hypothetical protein